jgi:signal transduction histidine kinase
MRGSFLKRPPSLSFDPANEAGFQAAWFRSSVGQIRILVGAGAVLYLVPFVPFDYVVLPYDRFLPVTAIRFATALALCGVLALTYWRNWIHWWQIVVAATIIMMSVSVTSMAAVAPADSEFRGLVTPSFMLYLMITFSIARLRFRHAVGTALLLLAVYNTYMIAIGATSMAFLFGNNMILLSAVVLGMIGAHSLERYVRSDYIRAQEVERAYAALQRSQAQLVLQEKLASLGRLTAGIAHEIKNPLNFINNFARLNVSLTGELREEVSAGRPSAEIDELVADIEANSLRIAEHGSRADGIVRSMLEHSRASGGGHQLVDLNALVDEYVGLAVHGMRAQRSGFDCAVEKDLDPTLPRVQVVPQDIGRVLLNLLSNALHAVDERRMSSAAGGYSPSVRVSTRATDTAVQISVSDNGPGIPTEVKEQIFEPFFTTKAPGDGTGLGLSLSHDIVVQGHGGGILVESAEGEGTTFIVSLPVGLTMTQAHGSATGPHVRPAPVLQPSSATAADRPPGSGGLAAGR